MNSTREEMNTTREEMNATREELEREFKDSFPFERKQIHEGKLWVWQCCPGETIGIQKQKSTVDTLL